MTREQVMEEALEHIKQRRMWLREKDEDGHHPHRPDISVWSNWEPGLNGAYVALTLDSLWGQPTRFLVLTAKEARQLAQNLNEVAAEMEEVTGNLKVVSIR